MVITYKFFMITTGEDDFPWSPRRSETHENSRQKQMFAHI